MHQQINTVYLNIDVEYRLVNEQLGTVMHIAKNHRNEAFNFFLFIYSFLFNSLFYIGKKLQGET